MIRQSLPNTLSALRVVSVPLMCWAIAARSAAIFAPLLAFCLGTDLLDGYLARRWQVQSKLGAVLDTVADLGGIGCLACGMAALYRPLLDTYAGVFAMLALTYLAAHVCSLVVRRMPATFSGSLGRPAMAGLALFALGLATGTTPALLIYAVCALGSACAVQELSRSVRLVREVPV